MSVGSFHDTGMGIRIRPLLLHVTAMPGWRGVDCVLTEMPTNDAAVPKDQLRRGISDVVADEDEVTILNTVRAPGRGSAHDRLHPLRPIGHHRRPAVTPPQGSVEAESSG